MSLKTLFKPTKQVIIADIILAAFWIILFLAVPFFGFQKAFLAASMQQKIITALVSFLFSAVVYYPLTWSLVTVYRKITKAKVEYLGIAIAIIIIWNPFTLSIILSQIMNFNNTVINQPCGVQVAGFSDNSPAFGAGITVGEIITAVDGTRVETTDALRQELANKRPGDKVTLTTITKNYDVQLAEDPQSHNAVLGVAVKNAFCKRNVPVACTQEAKICPDGTAVGRVSPDCEFAPCPGE